MATLAWSPALRSEIKRMKLFGNESVQATSNAQHASGFLSQQEKKAVEKTFSVRASEHVNKAEEFWI